MPRKIIAVEVDVTVVDSLTPWLDWFVKETGLPRPVFDKYQYYLNPILNDLARKTKPNFESYDFWAQADLYDSLEPVDGSVKYLSQLHELGFDIIFVSMCHPNHEQSKRKWLKIHFPFAQGFVSTSDKQFVRYDYIIDDHVDNVLTCWDYNLKSEHILFDGAVKRAIDVVPELPKQPITCWRVYPKTFSTWFQIANFIYPNINYHLANLEAA